MTGTSARNLTFTKHVEAVSPPNVLWRLVLPRRDERGSFPEYRQTGHVMYRNRPQVSHALSASFGSGSRARAVAMDTKQP